MPTLYLLLFLGLALSLACGSRPNSGVANTPPNQNVASTLPANSNLNPNNSLLTNSKVDSNTNNAQVDLDIYKKLEAQQLEDKRLAEEKLKNGGNKGNSNAPAKSSVPKGKPTTY
jgi:hypothetical protein